MSDHEKRANIHYRVILSLGMGKYVHVGEVFISLD